jgi:hypothetical protein
MSLRNGHAANGATHRNGTAPEPALKPVADAAAPAPKRGRPFEVGNTYGRGNPFFRKQAEVRKAILDDLGVDAIRKLMRKLYDQAMGGDVNAARVVLNYAIGKPAPVVDPDRADLNEWALADAAPTLPRIWAAMIECLSPLQALQLFQDALATKAGQSVRDLQPADLERVAAEMRAKIGK